MRSFMLLGLVALVGCGASQAAPIATPASAAVAPPPEIVASAPADATAAAIAALAQVPGGPSGWRVDFTSGQGSWSTLAGRTVIVPNSANGQGGSAQGVVIQLDSQFLRVRFGDGQVANDTARLHGGNIMAPQVGMGICAGLGTHTGCGFNVTPLP